MIEMDIKYPIENKYMKFVLQIHGFSGLHSQVRSSRQFGSGLVRGSAIGTDSNASLCQIHEGCSEQKKENC